MEKLTQRVRRSFTSWQKGLQKGLEDVLEHDPRLDHKEPVESFEITTDLSHLKETLSFLPHEPNDRLIHLFSRLAPYFESGVLLYKHSDEATLRQEVWSPGAVFFKGHYYPLDPKHLKLHLYLPQLKKMELKKTSPYSILQQLHLNEISDSTDASAFAFKADAKYLFLVFSELPEPWLRTHIENIYKVLMSTLPEYSLHSLENQP